MSAGADGIKGALYAVVRAALSRVDYFALYRAKVVRQSGDKRKVDVVPEDNRLPGMAEVPLKLGLPGAKVTIAPGAWVLLGWDGGDPSKPHALVFEGGETVLALELKAATVTIEATSVTVDALNTNLGGANLVPVMNGVVTGEDIDTVTSMPNWMTGKGSALVMAKKA